MLPDSFYIILKHCLSKFSPENQSFLHCLATPSCCQIQSIDHHNTTRNTIFNPACISQLLKFYWVKLHLVIVVKQIFIFFCSIDNHQPSQKAATLFQNMIPGVGCLVFKLLNSQKLCQQKNSKLLL